jgi:hypothetical protein
MECEHMYLDLVVGGMQGETRLRQEELLERDSRHAESKSWARGRCCF